MIWQRQSLTKARWLPGIPYFGAIYGMTRYDHFLRLLVLLSMVLAGVALTVMVSIGLAVASGIPLETLLQGQETSLSAMSAGTMRALLTLQHLFIFILPAIASAWLFHREGVFDELGLAAWSPTRKILRGIFFLLAALPIVQLAVQVNEYIPLPGWAHEWESEAENTLRLILNMPTPWVFLVNLLVIAILPGLGEEMIFRGLVQQHLGGVLRSPVAAIWITGFLFSAIHFQFEGFLPRMILGVSLGYLYHWTGNLWVSVAAHAFNNAVQVAFVYATGMDLREIDQAGTDTLPLWLVPASLGLLYLLRRQFLKDNLDAPAD